MGFITNQKDIVECAKDCYANFKTIVNNIPKSTVKYNNTLDDYANIDNKLASSQSAIGESSNLAQLAQSYMYSFDNKKYQDYVCILSVIAQCCIDNAKRVFDINIVDEISRIKKDLDIDKNGYPIFWKTVKNKKKTNFNNDKINDNLICPMNYLATLKFQKFRNLESTLPMDYFFVDKYDNPNYYMSKKIEKLVLDYSIELFNYNCETTQDGESQDILKWDYEILIDEISKIKISKKYVAIVAYLVDRTFKITPQAKNSSFDNISNKMKYMVLKVLFDISPKNILYIFSKNSQK